MDVVLKPSSRHLPHELLGPNDFSFSMLLELITDGMDFDGSSEDVSYNDAAKEDVLVDKDSKWRVALRYLSIHTPNNKLRFEVISRPEPNDYSDETTSPLPVSPRLPPKSTFKDNGDPNGGAGPSNAPAAPQPTERTLQISQLEERLQRSTISPPLSRPPNTLLPSTRKHSRTSTTPSSEGSLSTYNPKEGKRLRHNSPSNSNSTAEDDNGTNPNIRQSIEYNNDDRPYNQDGKLPAQELTDEEILLMIEELGSSPELSQFSVQQWVNCCAFFKVDSRKRNREDKIKIPGLQVDLFPHQAFAVYWMLHRKAYKILGVFLSDDIGLGKTLTVLGFWASTVANYRNWQMVLASRKSSNEIENRKHL